LDLKLESRKDFLFAKVTGQVSLNEALKVYKKTCDAAVRRDFGKILFDCLGLTGELSELERYELGRQGAEYCRKRCPTLKTAVIGKPPTVDGFVAQVASNRGMVVEIFSERQAALDWLNAFGSKAAGS
jgi:hypothetical protein